MKIDFYLVSTSICSTFHSLQYKLEMKLWHRSDSDSHDSHIFFCWNINSFKQSDWLRGSVSWLRTWLFTSPPHCPVTWISSSRTPCMFIFMLQLHFTSFQYDFKIFVLSDRSSSLVVSDHEPHHGDLGLMPLSHEEEKNPSKINLTNRSRWRM